jgi:hypothetical protein
MDSIFVEIRGAKRNSPESLEYLAKILVIARDGMDVVWLADMIDHLYTFWGNDRYSLEVVCMITAGGTPPAAFLV